MRRKRKQCCAHARAQHCSEAAIAFLVLAYFLVAYFLAYFLALAFLVLAHFLVVYFLVLESSGFGKDNDRVEAKEHRP